MWLVACLSTSCLQAKSKWWPSDNANDTTAPWERMREWQHVGFGDGSIFASESILRRQISSTSPTIPSIGVGVAAIDEYAVSS